MVSWNEISYGLEGRKWMDFFGKGLTISCVREGGVKDDCELSD